VSKEEPCPRGCDISHAAENILVVEIYVFTAMTHPTIQSNGSHNAGLHTFNTLKAFCHVNEVCHPCRGYYRIGDRCEQHDITAAKLPELSQLNPGVHCAVADSQGS
jgi:hypothetical protein